VIVMDEGGKGESKQRDAARVALMGYGDEAREQAVRLRALGWHVSVALRPGGTSWIRAVADGLRPVVAREAVRNADVVVVHLPESEQPSVWAQSIAPHLAPGALVVFAHGAALFSGMVEPDPRFDVVLVTRRDADLAAGNACRVAVHRDATGRAFERAAGYARAVYGESKVGTTTLASEVQSDLSALVERLGGVEALLAEWDRVLANPGHEPDEATLRHYERLREAVLAGTRPAELARPPSSRIELPKAGDRGRGRDRGAA
jgi:ketol-acid reductoisomerase